MITGYTDKDPNWAVPLDNVVLTAYEHQFTRNGGSRG